MEEKAEEPKGWWTAKIKGPLKTAGPMYTYITDPSSINRDAQVCATWGLNDHCTGGPKPYHYGYKEALRAGLMSSSRHPIQNELNGIFTC